MASIPFPAQADAEGYVIAQKYRLESLLGEGGMGAVWRAFNLQLEVPVAIKLLRTDLNASASELGERLRIEARAAAKLVHPGIVRVFDIGEAESGEPFIVMELLTGESLGDMLERGPLAPIHALQLLLPIAEGLSLAHSRGVVHRDLKPDNIFIAIDGSAVQPKLLDFGIAKVQSAMVAGAPILTQTGTLLGSPDYMSPEQACGRSDIDERSDVWSFCVVLYEALTGGCPFTGDSCQTILRSVVQDQVVPLDVKAGIEPGLSAIVQRGLSKAREARPPSIFELGCELARWLHDRGVLEDVTGSSLEAKWLGRSADSLLLDPGASTSPRAQHEHATLVSVVHPSPRPSNESIRLPLRRQRWVPSALASGGLLVACLGWASLYGMQRRHTGATNTPISATLPAQAAQLAPSRVDAVAVEALPLEPVLEAKPLAAQPPQPPVQAAASRSKPYAEVKAPSGPTRPAQLSLPKAAIPKAATSALPQALPLRETRTELLNPY
jgi:serine/threonine protein kinase